MTATNWTKDEAKAADAILSDLYAAAYKADSHLGYAASSLHYAVDDKKHYRYSRNGNWTMTNEQALQVAKDRGDKPVWGRPGVTYVDVVAEFEAEQKATDAAWQATRDHDAANYKGWQRFFLVPGGHIHGSTACSSLRITTQIGWLPQLSGETEESAVAEYGPELCSKCFKSAPVEWTFGKKGDAARKLAG